MHAAARSAHILIEQIEPICNKSYYIAYEFLVHEHYVKKLEIMNLQKGLNEPHRKHPKI